MAKERSIRVGAAGVVIRDGKILLVKFDDENGPHYNYPGGGHQEGETLRQTAAREVLEETNAEVEVGRLLVVGEAEPGRVGHVYGDIHHLKLFFECTLKPGSEPRLPDSPDINEVAVEWISIDQLSSLPLIPEFDEELLRIIESGETIHSEDDGEAARRLNNS